MKHLVAIALGLAFQAFSGSASAQASPPPAGTVLRESNTPSDTVMPEQLHRFGIRAQVPGRRLEVRSSHDVPIARCITGCWLNLPSGDYRVVFYDVQAKEHEFEFTVSGPGGIEIGDADESTATTGLAFGIVGAGAVAAGTVLMMVGFNQGCMMSECEEDRDNRSAGMMMLGGLGAVVAGGIMTPIGFVTWSRNRNPRLHQNESAIDVAVVPTSSGAFLGLSGRF